MKSFISEPVVVVCSLFLITTLFSVLSQLHINHPTTNNISIEESIEGTERQLKLQKEMIIKENQSQKQNEFRKICYILWIIIIILVVIATYLNSMI